MSQSLGPTRTDHILPPPLFPVEGDTDLMIMATMPIASLLLEDHRPDNATRHMFRAHKSKVLPVLQRFASIHEGPEKDSIYLEEDPMTVDAMLRYRYGVEIPMLKEEGRPDRGLLAAKLQVASRKYSLDLHSQLELENIVWNALKERICAVEKVRLGAYVLENVQAFDLLGHDEVYNCTQDQFGDIMEDMDAWSILYGYEGYLRQVVRQVVTGKRSGGKMKKRRWWAFNAYI